ncbi:MAG TPA: hypothetical protein VF990_05540, partial [Candidatus Dormibacteraeota bacterium]
GPLPALMAVIVTSSSQQSGSKISGDIVEIVIVKTDPGYEPNPGHAGTGTVLAALCGPVAEGSESPQLPKATSNSVSSASTSLPSGAAPSSCSAGRADRQPHAPRQACAQTTPTLPANVPRDKPAKHS